MRNALILIGLILIGTYLAVTKSLPFGSEYELKAVFENAANIRKDSPVRIAGVNVGKVKSVRSVGDARRGHLHRQRRRPPDPRGRAGRDPARASSSRATSSSTSSRAARARPSSTDGGTIPITQTSTAVQLDQVLTTLQAPDRENL